MGSDACPGKRCFCRHKQFPVESKARTARKINLIERLGIGAKTNAEITENFPFSQTDIKHRSLRLTMTLIGSADSKIDNGANLPMMSFQVLPQGKSGFHWTDAGNELVQRQSFGTSHRFESSHFLLRCSDNQVHDLQTDPLLNLTADNACCGSGGSVSCSL
jgi:hypothetical protein